MHLVCHVYLQHTCTHTYQFWAHGHTFIKYCHCFSEAERLQAKKGSQQVLIYFFPQFQMMQFCHFYYGFPLCFSPGKGEKRTKAICLGVRLGEKQGREGMQLPYLPDLVITISVPRLWNCSQSSLASRWTLGSSSTSSSGSKVFKGLK